MDRCPSSGFFRYYEEEPQCRKDNTYFLKKQGLELESSSEICQLLIKISFCVKYMLIFCNFAS